jgi:mannose-1-phosphate guanylyltransferase/phosphomannomutase
MPVFLERYLKNCWVHKKGLSGRLKAVLLAAGLGKRMDPLTAHYLPKPMFPLGGAVPIAETWVRKCVESGITDISMNLCVLANTVRNYFQDGLRFGAKIHYVDEGEKPSGTLGGVCKQVLGNKAKLVSKNEKQPQIPAFDGTTVLVLSGDIVTNFSSELLGAMYEIHKTKGAAFTMILSPVPWDSVGHFGTAELRNPEIHQDQFSKSGRVVNFIEKDPNSASNLNNASVYMIEVDFLKEIDSQRTEVDLELDEPFYDFGKHVFPALLGKIDYVKIPKDAVLWGIQYDGLWYDVGRKRDYLKVNTSLLEGDIKIFLPYERFPWGYLGHNVTIDFKRVTIQPPVIIGNNCVIEPDAELGPCVILGDDWTVSRGTRISNSVLWKRYDYFNDNGQIWPASARKLVDRHEIERDVRIDNCIIIGGRIGSDLKEETVDVLEDGSIERVPIDWVPPGKRA